MTVRVPTPGWPLVLLAITALPAAAGPEAGWPGEVVPADFTPMAAPMNTLRLPHWGSSSNGVQLRELVEEGARVEPGTVVAVFGFDMERAREYLDQRLRQLEAERDERMLEIRRRITEQENRLVELEIQKEKLGLDRLKGRSLSRLKQTLLTFDFDLKSLELEAQTHRLEGARRELTWSTDYYAEWIASWRTYFDVYERTRDRYTVRAPVAGTLHYPILDSSNRKVRKGDDMNSGTHFLSLVLSDRARLRFFLPEQDWSRVRIGDEVRVHAVNDPPMTARVDIKSPFPQFMGDARRNFLLPDAWEKCFVVEADLPAPFSTIREKSVTVGVDLVNMGLGPEPSPRSRSAAELPR